MCSDVLFFILVCNFLLATPASAQTEPQSFGNVSLSELRMETFNADTSADAVMLFDKGVVRLDGNSNIGTTYKKSMRLCRG